MKGLKFWFFLEKHTFLFIFARKKIPSKWKNDPMKKINSRLDKLFLIGSFSISRLSENLCPWISASFIQISQSAEIIYKKDLALWILLKASSIKNWEVSIWFRWIYAHSPLTGHFHPWFNYYCYNWKCGKIYDEKSDFKILISEKAAKKSTL